MQSTAESHKAIAQTGLTRLSGEGWLNAIRRAAAAESENTTLRKLLEEIDAMITKAKEQP